MQLFIVFAILLWFIHITHQVTISRRQYPQQIQFASIPNQVEQGNKQFIEGGVGVAGEEQQQEEQEQGTHRSKRLSDNQQLSTTYRNPFAAFLKRKRHSKSTDSRLSIKKDLTSADSKCGLMCHLLCRPGCSKICYSSCT
ncbi:unnamed protein product [Schistosoma rodhaini]|nr:unnamed protein product [Schistosoma rodhaini]